MGAGAIFIGHMAEVVVPTLLIYALTYAGAKNTWKVKSSWAVVLGLFFVTVLAAGFINALLYSQLNIGGYDMIAIFMLPLVVSLAVIYFLAPRRKESAT
jgi:hypothetical protein